MLRPARLFKWGVALLLISVFRVIAFPISDPVDPDNLGLWSDLYRYSVMIWIPAAIMIALSAIMPAWFRVIRWVENGR